MKTKNTIIYPSLLAKLLQVSNCQRAVVRPEGIQIYSQTGSDLTLFKDIENIDVNSGLLWREVLLSTKSKKLITIRGLRKSDTDTLNTELRKAFDEFHRATSTASDNSQLIYEVQDWINRGLAGHFWVANHEVEITIQKIKPLATLLSIPAEYITRDSALSTAITTLQKFVAEPSPFRSEANTTFTAFELKDFASFFAQVEANPLTRSQQLAIISHEDNTRVIAGAGSGKTSVIVAKAGYLIRKGLCKPEEILLIAFNKSAAAEISERIRTRIGIEVRATTFHALGLSIIGEATGKKPSLAKSAEDPKSLTEQLRSIITDMLDDPMVDKAVRTYFQSFFSPYKSADSFATLGDYYLYLNDQDIRTICGELVKSYEEAEIANFLFINGIEYEYERPYDLDTANEHYRQYEPDFFLTDSGIYIEHFGIDRDGATAPDVPQQEYEEGMAWKRSLHEAEDTVLIETFSYMKKEGVLASELEKKLIAAGVKISPISKETLRDALEEGHQLDSFTDLVASFLGHFKGNGFTIDRLKERANKLGILNPRLLAFFNVFSPLYERYESQLRQDKVTDFNDMIIHAAKLAEDSHYPSPYSYILVDEFQDISAGRARLVKSLSNQRPSNRLFCVGDDWQAIYRFAGSDISLMRNFSNHFGFTETIHLDNTFRFNDRIEAVATKFILKNPSQITKSIQAIRTESSPRIFIHLPTGHGDSPLLNAVGQIYREEPRSSVLLLGRYHFLKDDIPWTDISNEYPTLSVDFKTIHSAKGTEADYVVLLGISSGKYGFPSKISDDPILNTVLSEPEKFSHAEERRLFYVALTRARHAVHLISAKSSPSEFLTEIMEDSRNVEVSGLLAEGPAKCRGCGSGDMVFLTGKYGSFYGCSNHPLCETKARVCSLCNVGGMLKGKTLYTCSAHECSHTERACPSCETGRLVEKKGKYGAFLGCTNFARKDDNCRHTEQK